MSWKVVEEIVERSRAKHGTRLCLLAIGEIAHHDGVAFVTQGPEIGREGKGESIAERAMLSVTQVGRCILTAQVVLDELEVREFRRGRVKYLCYRVIVGRLRDLEADHERLRSKLTIELDRPFSTPAELALSRAEREALTTEQIVGSSERFGGDDLSGGQAVDDPTSAPRRPDKSDCDDPTSATALRAGATMSTVQGTVPDSSLTFSSENQEENVPAEIAGASGNELADQLLRAFAEELGAWPTTRNEWGAWKAAFSKLATSGATVEELQQRCRSYRQRWDGELNISPFGLTKHWLVIGASLEQSFFGLMRWVCDTSWRLDPDDVTWILDNANVTRDERVQLRSRAIAERHARQDDPATEVLRWVEREGWALEDHAWRMELGVRIVGNLEAHRDLRRRAFARRLELRQTIAQLKFGAAS